MEYVAQEYEASLYGVSIFFIERIKTNNKKVYFCNLKRANLSFNKLLIFNNLERFNRIRKVCKFDILGM